MINSMRILPAVGMRTGRPVARIELSGEDTGILEGYTPRRKTAQALALRARIVLSCAAGLSNQAVAARERVTAQTVGKWRQRFVEHGPILLRHPRRARHDLFNESLTQDTSDMSPKPP
jgi:Homeodomain-like domain